MFKAQRRVRRAIDPPSIHDFIEPHFHTVRRTAFGLDIVFGGSVESWALVNRLLAAGNALVARGPVPDGTGQGCVGPAGLGRLVQHVERFDKIGSFSSNRIDLRIGIDLISARTQA